MQLRSSVCGAIAVLASLFLSSLAMAGNGAPVITFVDGTGTLISGGHGFLPAAGVPLHQCDVVRTGPKGLVQVEYDDGGKIELGPDSGMLFGAPGGGDSVAASAMLLAGWAKLAVPKRDNGPPYRLDTQHFGMLVDAGVTAVRTAADHGQFFVEQGDAIVLESGGRPGARVNVGTGHTYLRNADDERGSVTDGIDPNFVKGMPRVLRDTVPSLLAHLEARDLRPDPVPDYNPADTEAWLKTVPPLRACFGDVTVLGAQEALKRGGFNVGPLDGILGPRTQAALRAFQQQRGLARTGQLDQDTLGALGVPGRP